MRMKRPTLAGFTIIEVLITISVLFCALAVSVPALAKKSLVQSEAQKIVRALETMTTKAMFSGEDLTLKINRQEVVGINPKKPKKKILYRDLNAKTYIISERKELRFYHQGVCSPASFTLTDGRESCVIKLSLRGRASMECR